MSEDNCHTAFGVTRSFGEIVSKDDCFGIRITIGTNIRNESMLQVLLDATLRAAMKAECEVATMTVKEAAAVVSTMNQVTIHASNDGKAPTE